MSQTQWLLQDAKNRSSRVVEAARQGAPQTVTKYGTPDVAVPAAEEYERLQHLEKMLQPSFGEHLLAMPMDGGEFEHLTVVPRDVAL